MGEVATESPYMTLDEAAQYIRQESPTLERWARDGEVAYIKTPKGRIFTRDVLDQFMLARLKGGNTRTKRRR